MEALGGISAILVIFWAIASLFLPFFIWGTYNQSVKAAKELVAIRKLLAQQPSAAGEQQPAQPAKVGLFD